MTTGKRATYNRIKDLQGMIYGLTLVKQNNSTVESIDKLISDYNDDLMSLTKVWFDKYSTNENVDSAINKLRGTREFNEMFYCHERTNLYNDIRELAGIVSGLHFAAIILKETDNDYSTIDEHIDRLEHTLRAEMRVWRQNYASNKTINSYELPM